MNASVKSAPVITTVGPSFVGKPVMMPAPRVAPVAPPVASPSKLVAQAPVFTSPTRAPNPLVSVASFHSTTSQRPYAPSYVASLPSLPRPAPAPAAAKEDQHWVAVATERLWPAASRYFSKHLVSNFDDEASDAKLDEMAQERFKYALRS